MVNDVRSWLDRISGVAHRGVIVGSLLLSLASVISLSHLEPVNSARAQEPPPLGLSIDANVENGACRDASGQPSIDRNREVAAGDEYLVGICLRGQSQAPDAFEVRVLYDRELTEVPEVEDAPPALDDNPDANDGDGGTAGDKLGAGWDCSLAQVPLFPTGDEPTTAEPDAFIFCFASIGGAPDVDLSADPGLLALVRLRAKERGVDRLAFSAASNVFGVNCPPLGDLTCGGASIYIDMDAPAVEPEPTPVPTAAPPPTASPSESGDTDTSPVAGSTPANSANTDDGDGSRYGGVIVAVIAAVLLLGAAALIVLPRLRRP